MRIGDVIVPSWCNYPDANAGIMGCWSLNFAFFHKERKKRYGASFCAGCDLYNSKVTNEKEVMKNQYQLYRYHKMLGMIEKHPGVRSGRIFWFFTWKKGITPDFFFKNKEIHNHFMWKHLRHSMERKRTRRIKRLLKKKFGYIFKKHLT